MRTFAVSLFTLAFSLAACADSAAPDAPAALTNARGKADTVAVKVVLDGSAGSEFAFLCEEASGCDVELRPTLVAPTPCSLFPQSLTCGFPGAAPMEMVIGVAIVTTASGDALERDLLLASDKDGRFALTVERLEAVAEGWTFIEFVAADDAANIEFVLQAEWSAAKEKAPLACGYERDTNGDGQVEEKWLMSYDDAGNLVTESGDTDGDRVPDSFVYFGYTDGLMSRYASDDDGDGKEDYIYEIVYDDSGLEIENREDVGGDGWDSVSTYEYKDGLLSVVTTDADFDGTPDERTTYEQDKEGRNIATFTDRGLDGTVETSTAFHYNDQGKLARRERRTGTDGDIQSITHYDYDREGRRIGQRFEYPGADGTFELLFEFLWTYGEAGELQTMIYDSLNGDASITTYRYGSCGGHTVRRPELSLRAHLLRAGLAAEL